MSRPPLPIAVTMGEPSGIGGEVLLKAWLKRRAEDPPFFAIDDPERLKRLAHRFGLAVPIVSIGAPANASGAFHTGLPVMTLSSGRTLVAELGRPNAADAAAVIASIDTAVDLAKAQSVAAIVTAPIHKHTLAGVGFGFPGHTEYLGHLSGGQRAVMMLTVETVDPPLRVVPVTVHVPLAQVAQRLSTADIAAVAGTAAVALKRDFGIAAPRLAFAALNPHGGESGVMGDEEDRIIRPAVAGLVADGVDAVGPFPADTLFHSAARSGFDAVICMYHDQALIPLKTLDFTSGVNVTLGLPFVRTSPDHGTALDIATRGIADPGSMIQAISLAGRMAAQRARRA